MGGQVWSLLVSFRPRCGHRGHRWAAPAQQLGPAELPSHLSVSLSSRLRFLEGQTLSRVSDLGIP